MRNYLLATGAALALLSLVIPAHAGSEKGGKTPPGTVNLSFGFGKGEATVYSYGPGHNNNGYATTTNVSNQWSSASVKTPGMKGHGEHRSHHKGPSFETHVYSSVTNESLTESRGNAVSTAGGGSVSTAWGAITNPEKGDTFGRSAGISGGLSHSYSESSGNGAASGLGIANADAGAYNSNRSQESYSSSTGGGVASAYSEGEGHGYSSAGGISGGISSTY